MEPCENKLDAYLSSLTPTEKLKFDGIRHTSKRLEFAASRFLRTALFGPRQIYYTEVGSPYIEDEGFISLSHTHGLVGLAHSHRFNVGLDIETVRGKAAALQQKFIHPTEKDCFDPADAFDMSLLWSFKETLFKLAGRRGVHFSSDLIVRKEGERFFGSIDQYHVHHEYELTWQLVDQYLITCNAGPEKIDSIEATRTDI